MAPVTPNKGSDTGLRPGPKRGLERHHKKKAHHSAPIYAATQKGGQTHYGQAFYIRHCARLSMLTFCFPAVFAHSLCLVPATDYVNVYTSWDWGQLKSTSRSNPRPSRPEDTLFLGQCRPETIQPFTLSGPWSQAGLSPHPEVVRDRAGLRTLFSMV